MDRLQPLADILIAQPGWIWLSIGAVLFVVEILVPGIFFVWFALAAAVTGGVLFVWSMTVSWQIAVFCVLSVITLAIGRATWGSYKNPASDKPLLNLRGQQLVGRTLVLAEAISGGRGRVKAGDGMWLVTGPDLPADALVRVTGVEGTMLVVEQA